MLRVRVIKFLLVALLASSVHATDLYAETYISPELVHITTPVYRPELDIFNPPLGTYTYTVSWQGIPAATVTTSVEQEGMQYHIIANVETYSGIDILYKLRYRAEGALSSVDLSPINTKIDQRENSRHKITEITFHPNGEIESVRSDLKKNETKTLRFEPGNLMLDPFGAAFLARSLSWEKGQTRSFDTFNGKSRYLITFTCEDKIQMEVNKVLRDVWIISPQVKNLSYPDSEGKLRKANIYVTADRSRDILKIISSVFIGSVTTELDSFQPTQKPPAGTSVAISSADSYLK